MGSPINLISQYQHLLSQMIGVQEDLRFESLLWLGLPKSPEAHALEADLHEQLVDLRKKADATYAELLRSGPGTL